LELARSTKAVGLLPGHHERLDNVFLKVERVSAYRFSIVLLLADMMVLLAFGMLPVLLYDSIDEFAVSQAPAAIGAALLLFVIASRALDAHAPRKIFEWKRGIVRGAASFLLTFFLLMIIGLATKTAEDYSRVWFFSWFGLSLLIGLCTRMVLLAAAEAKLARGACLQRALIISCGENPLTGVQLALDTGNRIRAVGTIAASDLESVPDLIPFLRQLSPEVVILSLPLSQVGEAMSKLKVLSQFAIEVLVLPKADEGLEKSLRIRRIGGKTLLQIAEPPLAEWDAAAKRVEDLVVASIGLILIFPVLLLVALAIRLESKGSVLFKQKRAGFNGNIIEVWKFRSMYVEGTDHHAAHQTSRDDPRVTRVGQFIRRTSIDELPQLWNVVQGHMSVVGPRPHALATSAEGKLLDVIVDHYAARHRMKPGITGWAQINGSRGELRSSDQVKRRVDYDLYYIENWSILLDIKIILVTAMRVLYDPRAY
jgi:polysaccharide biosynthesis protein PslA